MIWGDSNGMVRHLLDDDTADQLLGGAVHPDDAPPGYEQVALLLSTAGSSPGGIEPTAAAATVAKMVEAIGDAGVSRDRRPRVVRRLLTAKLVAAAGAVVLSTGAAAAATGSLPDPIQDTVAGVVSHVGLDLPDSAPDHAGRAGEPDGSPGRAGGGQPGLPSDPGAEGGHTGRPEGGDPAAGPESEGRGSETSNWVQDQVHDVEGPNGPEIAPCLSGGHSRAGATGESGAGEVDCPLDPAENGPSDPDPAARGGAGQRAPVDGKAKADEAGGAGPQDAKAENPRSRPDPREPASEVSRGAR